MAPSRYYVQRRRSLGRIRDNNYTGTPDGEKKKKKKEKKTASTVHAKNGQDPPPYTNVDRWATLGNCGL